MTDNSFIAPLRWYDYWLVPLLLINHFINLLVNRYKAHPKLIAKKKKTSKGIHDSSTRIKVQLDHKTTMIVHSMQALKLWKKRYPLARVIAWFLILKTAIFHWLFVIKMPGFWFTQYPNISRLTIWTFCILHPWKRVFLLKKFLFKICASEFVFYICNPFFKG